MPLGKWRNLISIQVGRRRPNLWRRVSVNFRLKKGSFWASTSVQRKNEFSPAKLWLEMQPDTVGAEVKGIQAALVYCDVCTQSGHYQKIFINTDIWRERICGKGEGKCIPITGLVRYWWFQEDLFPRFQDNQHMKVAWLFALCTGRLYPPGNIPGTHFC